MPKKTLKEQLVEQMSEPAARNPPPPSTSAQPQPSGKPSSREVPTALYRLSLRGSATRLEAHLSKQLQLVSELYRPHPRTSVLSALLALALQQLHPWMGSEHATTRIEVDIEYDLSAPKANLRCDVVGIPDATPRGYDSYAQWEEFLAAQNVADPVVQATMLKGLKTALGAPTDA